MMNAGLLNSRRDALRKIGGSALGFLAASAHPAAAKERRSFLRGRVLDASEARLSRGVPGVMVSNGRDIVLSNAAGAYEIPVRDGDMVFVIKPPHWAFAGPAGVPQMSYRVSSAADAEVQGFVPVRPTGDASAHFYLRPELEPDAFDVLLFTDTHAGDDRELSFTREVIRQGIQGTRAAFALHHGDALADNFGMFAPYRDMLRDTGMVWHHCPGNHDMRLGQDSRLGGVETWMREMGPPHSAFRYGRATFILLNNVEDLGARAARADARPYRGAISRDQLRFVANVLRHVPEDDLVVLSMHIPLVSYLSPDAPTDTTWNRSALMGLLAGRPHTISFAGHSHTTEHHYLGRADGFSGAKPHHHQVLTAACGSWWGGPLDEAGLPVSVSRDGSPKGHHVLSVRGAFAETRFVPYQVDDQVRALVEERRLIGLAGITTALVNGRLVVNVFDGGPKTKVTCRFGGAEAQAMNLAQTAIEDPFVVETFSRERQLLKPWVYPARCSHLWTIDLPGTLPQGSHEITVFTEGEFGQRHEHALTLSV